VFIALRLLAGVRSSFRFYTGKVQTRRVGSEGAGSPIGDGLSGSRTGAMGEGFVSGGKGSGSGFDGSGCTGSCGCVGGNVGSPGCGTGSVGWGWSVLGLLRKGVGGRVSGVVEDKELFSSIISILFTNMFMSVFLKLSTCTLFILLFFTTPDTLPPTP
jgi:hypothetical protein